MMDDHTTAGGAQANLPLLSGATFEKRSFLRRNNCWCVSRFCQCCDCRCPLQCSSLKPQLSTHGLRLTFLWLLQWCLRTCATVCACAHMHAFWNVRLPHSMGSPLDDSATEFRRRRQHNWRFGELPWDLQISECYSKGFFTGIEISATSCPASRAAEPISKQPLRKPLGRKASKRHMPTTKTMMLSLYQVLVRVDFAPFLLDPCAARIDAPSPTLGNVPNTFFG